MQKNLKYKKLSTYKSEESTATSSLSAKELAKLQLPTWLKFKS